MQVKFNKVVTLPVTLDADTFYFVENGSYSESYLTDNAGVAKSVGNSAMINQLVANALAGWSGGASTISIVADIAARNALTATATANLMILVIDASADTTVDAGSALYAFDFTTTTTYKLAEYESMDVVVAWSEISGAPTSAVADIDDAVTKRHEHTNKTVLDKFSESGGSVLYDGSAISSEWETNNW